MVDIKPALPVSASSLVSQEIFNSNSKATPTSTPSNSSTITGDNGNSNNNNNNGIPECLATSPSATSSSLLALSYWTLCYSFISTTISKAVDRLQNRSSGECATVFMTQTTTLSSDSSNNIHSFHSNNFNNDNITFNNNSSQQTLQTSRIKSNRQLQQQIASSSIDNSSIPPKSTPSTRLRNPSRPTHQASTPGTSSFSSLMKTKTLILDLDETLIHSTSRGSRADAQMVEVMVNKHACLYYAYKRPYVDHFLKKVSEWYKVVIFTASMPEYADPVIDWLDPDKNLISSRYYRQSCTNRDGSYIKDLTIVEPDLSKVCLVDNCSTSYSMHQENGIPIEGWINDPNDEALLDLLPFLDALRFTEDVRSVLSLRNFS